MGHDRHAVLLEKLQRLAREEIEPLGLELVDLSLRGSSKKRVLRLDIDRAGPTGVGLEECQTVSGRVGRALDERDAISASYVLEVSSPGIDRPIRSDDDIRRNTGRRVRVETTEPWEGRRCFSGVLMGGETEWLELREDDDKVLRIPRDRIRTARQDVSF